MSSFPTSELILLFDYGGVISTSTFNVMRRYTNLVLKSAFDRLATEYPGATAPSLTSSNPDTAAQQQQAPLASSATVSSQYSNLFFDILKYTEKLKGTSSFLRLEEGKIDRQVFFAEFSNEISEFFQLFEITKIVKIENQAMSTPTTTSAAGLSGAAPPPPQRAPAMKPSTASGKAMSNATTTKHQILQRFPHFHNPELRRVVQQFLDPEAFLNIIEKSPLRRNVLNLLHFLRAASHQEVKIGILTNNWEAAGAYTANQYSMQRSGQRSFFRVICPRDYILPSSVASGSDFDVNGLFDVIEESWLTNVRKPNPRAFEAALAELGVVQPAAAGADHAGGIGAPTKPRYIFYFDDLLQNVQGARRSGKFTEVYHIRTGAQDVFTSVCAALSIAATRDPVWRSIGSLCEQLIGPLFADVHGPDGTPLSWILREITNYDGNCLFLPPPLCAALEPMDHKSAASAQTNVLSTELFSRILRWCALRLPQYFPFELASEPTPLGMAPDKHSTADGDAGGGGGGTQSEASVKLESRGGLRLPGSRWSGSIIDEPSVANSNGPVFLEYFRGGMSNPTYRITLRTGSFVLRKQPPGVLLPGAHNMAREYELCRHLEKTSKVPVPLCLILSMDQSVCTEQFYVMKFMEGRIIRGLEELTSPTIQRGFSQSRTRTLMRNIIKPRQFVSAAIDVLVHLHNAPLPPSLQPKKVGVAAPKKKVHSKKAAAEAPGKKEGTAAAVVSPHRVHPLMHLILIWSKQYERVIEKIKLLGDPQEKKVLWKALYCPKFEALSARLQTIFQSEQSRVPYPEKLCLTHGDFKLDNMMYSYRSFEGNPNYTPKFLCLLDFELANVGDPLTDVAYLTLMHYLPKPKGLVGYEPQMTSLFPSPMEILDEYLAKSSSLAFLSRAPKEVKEATLAVYQASMCHKLAGIVHGVIARALLGNASDPQGALKQQHLLEDLTTVGLELIQNLNLSASKL